MGYFDDLAPEKGVLASAPAAKGGYFDDLLPQKPAPETATFAQRFDAMPTPENPIMGGLKALGAGLGEGAIGLAGLPADLAGLGSKGLDYLAGTNTNETVAPYARRFGSENLQRHVEDITGPFHQANGPVESTLETAGQFLPALLGGPEAIGTKLLTRVAAPALASEAAGAATKGTAAEPFARFGAAVLGGGAAGAAAGAKRLAAPTEAALENAAKGPGMGYNSPAIKSLELAPQAGQDIADTIRNKLMAAKVDKFNGKSFYDIADRLENPRFGPTMTIDDLEAARQDAVVPPATATPADKRGAPAVKQVIDDYLNGNIPQNHVLAGDADAANAALKDARSNFAALKRSQDVSNALGRAENQAGSTYSGHNLDNATRQQLRPILNQKEGVAKSSAFEDYTPAEIAALKKAVNGSPWGNFVRQAGKTLGGGGGIGHGVAGLGTMYAAHEAGADPMTAILMGVGGMTAGRGLNKYANHITASQGKTVTDLLRQRSALAAQQAAQMGQPGVLANIAPMLGIQAAAANRLPTRITIPANPNNFIR